MLMPIAYVVAALIAGFFLMQANRKRPHDLLKSDLELFKLLPHNWRGREDLRKSIEERLEALPDSRNDSGISTPRMVALAVAFIVAIGVGSVAMYYQQQAQVRQLEQTRDAAEEAARTVEGLENALDALRNSLQQLPPPDAAPNG